MEGTKVHMHHYYVLSERHGKSGNNQRATLLKRSFANIKFRKLRTYCVCIFQSKERVEVKCRGCEMKLEHTGVALHCSELYVYVLEMLSPRS